jgi:hypothetical protein
LICAPDQLNGIVQLLNGGNRLLIIDFGGQRPCGRFST